MHGYSCDLYGTRFFYDFLYDGATFRYKLRLGRYYISKVVNMRMTDVYTILWTSFEPQRGLRPRFEVTTEVFPKNLNIFIRRAHCFKKD